MSDNTDLGMGLFDDNVELSFDDDNPFGDFTEDTSENNNTEDETSDNADKTNPNSEDQDDPDTVASEDNDDSNEGDEGDSSPNLFSSVATVLHEQGLLPSLDIEKAGINSADDLASAFSNQVDDLVKTKLVEKVGEEAYDYLINGVDVKQVEQHGNNMDYLNSLDADKLSSDIELSKNIIYQDFLNQGISEEKAVKFVDRVSSLGNEAIIEDATEALEGIKTFSKASIEQEKANAIAAQESEAKEQEEHSKKLKDSVYGVKELIPGQKIVGDLQEKVLKSMTTTVGKSPDGFNENAFMKARRENPIEFDTKMYYLYELTNGFTDFGGLTKAGKSSAIQEMERAMQHNTRINNSGAPNYTTDDKTYWNLGDDIVLE